MGARKSPSFLPAILVFGAGLSGCGGAGDTLPRQAVSGAVKLNGQPLADGSIQFLPDKSDSGVSVSGGGLIQNGRYAIGREQGLVPGTYKVLIFSHGETAAASAEPGAQTGPPPELIPRRYNTATTLSAAVAKDHANVFNYDLKK